MSESSPPALRSSRHLALEIICAYLVAVVLTVALSLWAGMVPLIAEHVAALVAAVFVGLPLAVLFSRKESLDDYGLAPDTLWREILWALATAAVIFPPFWLAFRWWWGWELSFELVVPAGYWLVALSHIVVVALPEELFFRGYLLTRLDQCWNGRVTIGGASLGWSLPATSLLFALGHYVITWDPERLAVFFPALVFGWLRVARGTITAAVVFHGLCNISMDLLLLGYGLVSSQE